MIATTCSVCGGQLRRVRETFDTIDRVWVVFSRCKGCGREYLGSERRKAETMARTKLQERQAAEREARNKAAAPARAKRPRQADLPGTEDRTIKALEDAAFQYAEIRDQRIDLNKSESDLKSTLLALMKKHGKKTYTRDGISIELVAEAETVKVKVRKAGEDAEEVDANEDAGEQVAAGNQV